MPNYTYAGLKQGEKVNGSIIAASRDDAVSRLKKDKIIITVLEPQDKSRGKSGLLSVRGRGKVPTKEVMVFSKKFATMVKSGLPILNTLQMLVDQTENKTFKKMVDEIHRDVESGVPMSEAFGKHKKVFDNIYVNMVKAGEMSGRLDEFLERLVISLEKTEKIKASVKKAMMYPSILLVTAILVIIIMMIFVVPVFADMFKGGTLPKPTQVVMAISDFFRDPTRGGMLGGTIVGLFVIIKVLAARFYGFRKFLHSVQLKAPALGDMVLKSALAKIAMIQGNLAAAGVAVLDSLDISAEATDNLIIKEALIEVKKGVYSGEPLSVLYRKYNKLFPMTFTELIAVGEETGGMEEMFGSISGYYEQEFDAAVENLTAMLEPIMIVFMGITIGGILVSMYMPIFQMGQTMH